MKRDSPHSSGESGAKLFRGVLGSAGLGWAAMAGRQTARQKRERVQVPEGPASPQAELTPSW